MSHRKLTDEQKAEQSKRFDKIIDSFIDEIEVPASSDKDRPASPSSERPRPKKLKSLDDIFQ